ncbi:MAG: NAD(P)-dependent oxidoreductase [Caldilineaceae bacterium SB0662_bin_9]|uniref:NAD(P)-dependent oxidoreductase n=1 Tax=Caldilineaceae bacterium SB0662_bin_9 TaxID=2605258 RepID=A0A6B1DX00_9CHLR|nr:NAD(P)-dependent oxidoreductase [Caldilineaceae bacterium]MYD91536.1 NAD(P)-dependent oxidoreductase [Caldilineaceae bacterium SB0662_bin_9]
MTRTGVIGLGDMGLGMARNLVDAGFDAYGFDLREERRCLFAESGGMAVGSVAELGRSVDIVFLMVLNGAQVLDILNGSDGLLGSMAPGSTVVVSATIKPREVEEAAALCENAGLRLLDSPVSGGQSGATAGTLSMMVAGPPGLLEEHRDVFAAVGGNVMNVGDRPGQGQTVKAVLQAVIGTTFAGIFEALVLGEQAGVDGRVVRKVLEASHVGSPLLSNTVELVQGRRFAGTGSNAVTMHKDLTITMDLALESGVTMFTTGAALQLMQATLHSFPGEDNWAAVKVLERLAGVEDE